MHLRSLLYRHAWLVKATSIVAVSFFLGSIAQLSPTVVSAQGGGTSGTIKNPIDAKDFLELVEAVARAITAIGIPLVAIFLVWAGFLFVTAQGSEEQLKRAKTTFFWALVGGAVVIGAWALAVAIVNFARNLGGGSNNPAPPIGNPPPITGPFVPIPPGNPGPFPPPPFLPQLPNP